MKPKVLFMSIDFYLMLSGVKMQC